MCCGCTKEGTTRNTYEHMADRIDLNDPTKYYIEVLWEQLGVWIGTARWGDVGVVDIFLYFWFTIPDRHLLLCVFLLFCATALVFFIRRFIDTIAFTISLLNILFGLILLVKFAVGLWIRFQPETTRSGYTSREGESNTHYPWQ